MPCLPAPLYSSATYELFIAGSPLRSLMSGLSFKVSLNLSLFFCKFNMFKGTNTKFGMEAVTPF